MNRFFGAKRRLKAVVAVLVVSTAAVVFNPEPAFAVQETWSGNNDMRAYVGFNSHQFYCSPGYLGTGAINVVGPPARLGRYAQVLDLLTWQPYGGNLHTDSPFPGGGYLLPGQQAQFPSAWLTKNGPLSSGYYRLEAQIQFLDPGGLFLGTVNLTATVPSDYVAMNGAFTATPYYCHI